MPTCPVLPNPHFQVPAPGGREGPRASNGGFGSEVGAYGRGKRRRCQNYEPLQAEREERREGWGRWKPGGHRRQAPGCKRVSGKAGRALPGSRHGGRAPGGTRQAGGPEVPSTPPPPPSKRRLAAAAARSALPGHGVGVAGRQGSNPNATKLGTVVASLQLRPHHPPD
jgi:hypothetical protein